MYHQQIVRFFEFYILNRAYLLCIMTRTGPKTPKVRNRKGLAAEQSFGTSESNRNDPERSSGQKVEFRGTLASISILMFLLSLQWINRTFKRKKKLCYKLNFGLIYLCNIFFIFNFDKCEWIQNIIYIVFLYKFFLFYLSEV